MRDGCRLRQNKFSTIRFGYKSFRYYGAKLWNSVPNDIRLAKSKNFFKVKYKRYVLSNYENLIRYF